MKERVQEKVGVFTSTVSTNPKNNEPKGISIDIKDQGRHFQRAKRLEPNNLEDNRFYIISPDSNMFYEVVQEKPHDSEWKILQPVGPVEMSKGDIYYQSSAGKWHKLIGVDEYGEPIVSSGIDLDAETL